MGFVDSIKKLLTSKKVVDKKKDFLVIYLLSMSARGKIVSIQMN